MSTTDRDADMLAAYGHRVAGDSAKTEFDDGIPDGVAMIDGSWHIVHFPPAGWAKAGRR